MIITVIRIRRLENTRNKMRGIADITLDDMIAIHDIKILKSQDLMFLAMPSRATKLNTFKDIVHPINSEVRDCFERLILGGYQTAVYQRQMYVEFRIKNTQKENLEEQEISDFDVVYLQKKQIVQQTLANMGKEVDEDLKKWLES